MYVTRSGKIQHFAELRFRYCLASWYVLCLSYKIAKYEHLQLYHQWVTELCNTAISIANIEGGKISHAHIHKKKMLDFRRFSHIRTCTYIYFTVTKVNFSNFWKRRFSYTLINFSDFALKTQFETIQKKFYLASC